MDPALEQLILERLGDSDLPEAAQDLVLAACEGAAELERAIGGDAAPRKTDAAQLELTEAPPGAYLESVAVQGFRGVGEAATLPLTPGPGLTIVAGRNGSGKSSFAEGLELLMTGASTRWATRTAVWREGWQNLHFDGPTIVEAAVLVDGQPGRTKLQRSWAHGEALSPGDCAVTTGDGTQTTLDALGWPAALSRYRPFLSFNELGQMFDELKTMYDALSAILGLDDIEALALALRDARLARDREAKALRQRLKDLTQRLAAIDDDRARTVSAALAADPPDLDAVELTLDGVDAGTDLHTLRDLAALRAPTIEAVDGALEALHEARKGLEACAGTDAGRAASLAKLLETALAHDEQHADGDCPVCGTTGVLDEAWRLESARAVARLQDDAGAALRAEQAVRTARRRVSDLLPAQPPPTVSRARDLGLDPSPLEDAWDGWHAQRDRLDDPAELARAREELDRLRDAAAGLAAAATEQLEQREDAWRPVAVELTRWLPEARSAVRATAALPTLKAAEAWARDAAAALRTQRLEPIAGAAKANWEALRQGSNVSLEGFHLRRRGNNRSAEVDVRVDGSDASAFGVMSQGELHALAISVFLPRAALAESPFRFMVIDDPVQSMDPSKVDGLARVLESAARSRQVVVFTHDERLPEAARRLGLDATVLEVTRRPGSVVEVRESRSPVERYLEDARALVRSEGVPAEVAERVVPGFCRHALEAACSQAVRRRRLGRGDAHADVEATLADATKLYPRLALALHDDEQRTSDVLRTIGNRFGKQHIGTVKLVNQGAHEPVGVDLRDLVRDTGVLAHQLADAQ